MSYYEEHRQGVGWMKDLEDTGDEVVYCTIYQHYIGVEFLPGDSTEPGSGRVLGSHTEATVETHKDKEVK